MEFIEEIVYDRYGNIIDTIDLTDPYSQMDYIGLTETHEINDEYWDYWDFDEKDF